MELEIIKNVLAALESEGVRYLVFGAVALNLLGLARATEDLDIFIAPERENIQRLKVALRLVFADPAIEEISADELLADSPAVQYIPPEGDFRLDILTRLGEAFQFTDLEALRADLDGQPVWVASPRTLYRMDTVRSKNRGDAELLRRRFNLEDEEANFRAFWERRRVAPADLEVSREPSLHEESADGVDLTLIRWTLGLTPLERLEVLQDWVDGLTELRRGRVPEH